MTLDLNASYAAFTIPHHRLTPSRDVIDDKRVVDYGRGEITNARSIEGCDNRPSPNYARWGPAPRAGARSATCRDMPRSISPVACNLDGPLFFSLLFFHAKASKWRPGTKRHEFLFLPGRAKTHPRRRAFTANTRAIKLMSVAFIKARDPMFKKKHRRSVRIIRNRIREMQK